MGEIEFQILTPKEGFSHKTTIPDNCGSSFFFFPGKPYSELPEFKNNLVIGSGGVNYLQDGEPKTYQLILRYDFGHNVFPQPHINVDVGTLKENKPVRKRKDSMAHIPLPDWIEIKMIDKENNKEETKRIDLASFKRKQ